MPATPFWCGSSIDSAAIFVIFAALAEFERALISERTIAGLAASRARGRNGGRPFKMTAAKVRPAMAATRQKEIKSVTTAKNSASLGNLSTATSRRPENFDPTGQG